MTLKELLEPLRFENIISDENPKITSLSMDSREVTAGTLFICIKGYTVDGHDFAKQAEKQGAVAIIAERELPVSIPVIIVRDSKRTMAKVACHYYNNPTTKLNLIGVTGTNGKTTVTHLLEKIMNDQKRKTGLIGTMYTKIGDDLSKTNNTTPESLPLQKLFSEMRENNVDTALMEVSSHALHLGRVHGCDFDIAIFTNLTPDHLDYHQTMEAYLYAKGLLFAQLGNVPSSKVAIINADDPASDELIRMTAVDVVTFGLDKKADVFASDIQLSASGTTFKLNIFDETVIVSMKLIGKFSVYNALAAAAGAYVSSVSIEDIKRSLEEVEGVAGRFETVDSGQDFSVIVDYAHTPDSLENVLQTVKQLAKKRVIAVVGCGGDRDRKKRPIMAGIASELADQTIFTSDNPRTEDPEAIVKDMVEGVKTDNYSVIIDREIAIKTAIFEAETDDIVLIAGKGHETYQIIGKQTIHFDDREVAKRMLQEKLDQV